MIGVYCIVAAIFAVLFFIGVCGFARYEDEDLDEEEIGVLIIISLAVGAFWIIVLPVAIFIGTLLLLKRFIDNLVDKIKDKKNGGKNED